MKTYLPMKRADGRTVWVTVPEDDDDRAMEDLIAAAKAALIGLEHAVHFAENWQDGGHPVFAASYQRRMDNLRAAIAKAEGR